MRRWKLLTTQYAQERTYQLETVIDMVAGFYANQCLVSFSFRKNCQYNVKHVQKIFLLRKKNVSLRQFITRTLVRYLYY